MNEYLFWTSIIILFFTFPAVRATVKLGKQYKISGNPDFTTLQTVLSFLMMLSVIIGGWTGFWLIVGWIGSN